MRRLLAIGLLASLLVLPAWGAPSAAQDEAAIRDVVKQYLEARDDGDAAAVRALFTEDADQLVSSGEWRRGREAIVKGTLASTKRSGGSRAIAIETVRFPAPGVALADGRYSITGSTTQADRRMWTAFVLVREQDGWRIAAIRNMLPAPQ